MAVALAPESAAAAERHDEVAAILAAGLVRLRCRRVAERRISTENCLEVPAETRLSGTVNERQGGFEWN